MNQSGENFVVLFLAEHLVAEMGPRPGVEPDWGGVGLPTAPHTEISGLHLLDVGLVVRLRRPGDRRVVHIELTQPGIGL